MNVLRETKITNVEKKYDINRRRRKMIENVDDDDENHNNYIRFDFV